MTIFIVTFTLRDDGLETSHCVGLATRTAADLFACEVKRQGGWDVLLREQEGDLRKCAKWPVVQ